MVNDEDWFERLGWSVSVVREELDAYRVDLARSAPSVERLNGFARGVRPELAVAHARERMEDWLVQRPHVSSHGQYPLTIISTRYSGTYEGGRWAAFPLYPEELPPEATGDDLDCMDWWSSPTVAVGVALTPDRAVAALDAVIDRCTHPAGDQLEVPAGFVCGFCRQLWNPDVPSSP